MAKELPYFKFEPNQWENGNIQMCSREDKGLFMDLCSMYWSRVGDLPFKLAINKLCGGNAIAFDSLMRENIFTVIDGLICIDFLNEQLEEFDNLSKVNSKNAKDGWRKRRDSKVLSERNATALNSQCENDAIREEKKREEKKREEKRREEEKESEKENRPTDCHRQFAHLSISTDEYSKLLETYTRASVNNVLDNIENFKGNKKYKSLYLTANNWLKTDGVRVPQMLKISV